MKKFLSLTLALVLVGTTVITLSEASRDAYHTYLYQQSLKQQGTRRFAAKTRIISTRDTQVNKEYTGRPNIQNLRYPRNKRDIFTKARQAERMNLEVRPMSNTIGFATAQQSRQTLSVKNLDATYLMTDTVVTKNFSVALPQGWTPHVENGVLSVGDNNTFAITVRQIEDACENVSFQSCAITLANDMNHLENIGSKINSLTRVARLTQRTDRIMGTNKYTNTHTESFLGTYLGRDVFITRYFVEEPETDNIYLLETIADREFASEAIVVAKRLSSSFRMITE